MKILYLISILFLLVLSSCKGQIDEIKRAHEIVEQAKKEIQTEEFQSKHREIQNSENKKISLSEKIDNSGLENLIESKKRVMAISNSLKKILANSKKLLTDKHGLDKNGNLRNKSEIQHVNQVFIEENRAKKIRDLFVDSEKEFLAISLQEELGLTNKDLPIKLNLFMEQEGKTWESYTFQDMPAMALLPIIRKLNNDVYLTELIMLEKLVSRMNTDDNN